MHPAVGGKYASTAEQVGSALSCSKTKVVDVEQHPTRVIGIQPLHQQSSHVKHACMRLISTATCCSATTHML